jgi:hypothetical protein
VVIFKPAKMQLAAVLVTAALFTALAVCDASAADVGPLTGSWLFVPTNTSQLALFASVALTVTADADTATLAFVWNGGSGILLNDSWTVSLTGGATQANITSRVFFYNVFQGFRLPVNGTRDVTGKCVVNGTGTSLVLAMSYPILSSQGPSVASDAVTLSTSAAAGGVLVMDVSSSTRSLPYTFTFVRQSAAALAAHLQRHDAVPSVHERRRRHRAEQAASGPRPANSDGEARLGPQPGRQDAAASSSTLPMFVYELDDDWLLSSRADEKALLLSLQGLANRFGPVLYFLYPQVSARCCCACPVLCCAGLFVTATTAAAAAVAAAVVVALRVCSLVC